MPATPTDPDELLAAMLEVAPDPDALDRLAELAESGGADADTPTGK